MTLPNLIIIFDEKIRQFDLSSLKLNQLPKKCDKLIHTMIEELNNIDELSYYKKHKFLYIIFVFIIIFAVLSVFFNFSVFVLGFTILCFVVLFFWILYKYKRIIKGINRIVHEYKICLRKYYSLKSHFFIKNIIGLKPNKLSNSIELKIIKSDFIIVNNYPPLNEDNANCLTERSEDIGFNIDVVKGAKEKAKLGVMKFREKDKENLIVGKGFKSGKKRIYGKILDNLK